jgi:hypothetical protein
MKDLTFKVLLGIIAVNLTVQTVKDVGLFPTAYAQSDIQRVAICDVDFVFTSVCASVGPVVNASGEINSQVNGLFSNDTTTMPNFN